MLDPASIAQGVATGIVTQKAMQATSHTLNRVTGQEETDPQAAFQQQALDYLRSIAEALNPDNAPTINEAFVLQPYPYEYITDAWNHDRAHICIFFATATPARLDIPGVGTYLKTLGPGWVQCDIPGNARISTTDTQNHGVIVSYRTDAIGGSL